MFDAAESTVGLLFLPSSSVVVRSATVATSRRYSASIVSSLYFSCKYIPWSVFALLYPGGVAVIRFYHMYL